MGKIFERDIPNAPDIADILPQVDTPLCLGVDVGSTTTKAVLLDAARGHVLLAHYARHHTDLTGSVRDVFDNIGCFLRAAGLRSHSDAVRVAVCGSGGRNIATLLDVPYVQEVVANSVLITSRYPSTKTAIELGGQDAKIIFFDHRPGTEAPEVVDMRMNGSCAGGTGAFIDEIAALLKVPPEGFDALAQGGKAVYAISGRCGVFAKTDIQPLLNQGVPRPDIALSTLHAIARQTIGGLAQGLTIRPPVVFEGGPLAFNPTLVRVFTEQLGLTAAEVVIPNDSETAIAHGAALCLNRLFDKDTGLLSVEAASALLDGADSRIGAAGSTGTTARAATAAKDAEDAEASGYQSMPFFATDAQREDFFCRHAGDGRVAFPALPAARELRVYLGIDSGSTTTKFALIDDGEQLVDEFYAPNGGEPLVVARDALIDLRERWRKRGVALDIAAVGTTGYGEHLFARAFRADYHVVETVAHAQAAQKYLPDASFILDIGGQDMKAVFLEDGVITNIIVNEACSSGCGSFLESFASSLGLPASGIAEAAFRAQRPAALGSRCTVFMNSRVITEQRDGRNSDEIIAGLCRSIIENVFTKVIRMSNLDCMGERVVVQGGTFQNDAVLRAFEQYLERPVYRPPHPGIMGAIGVALLAKRSAEIKGNQRFRSSFIGLNALDGFSYTQRSDLSCPYCENHCSRTLVAFSDGTTWVTGNRCERGERVELAPGTPAEAVAPAAATATAPAAAPAAAVLNLFKTRKDMLLADYPVTPISADRGLCIGLPLVLEFWDSLPFWRTFFTALGFTVKLSRQSTQRMLEAGLPFVASDTVCLPAKLVHGHIRNLVEQGVDRIFLPSIATTPSENTEANSEHVCAIVKGYPLVMRNSDNPARRFGVPFDNPLFYWYNKTDRDRQLCAWLEESFKIRRSAVLAAIRQADAALMGFRRRLQAAGARVLASLAEHDRFAVVLASRPYHNDSLVNHDLPSVFTRMGIPVLTVDSLPGLGEVDLSRTRLDIVNNFHARMLSSAILAAQDPRLEYVQIVSFGCGHDALLSDEISRLMRSISAKSPLVLKLDESDAKGPVGIRVSSFIESVRLRRSAATAPFANSPSGAAPPSTPADGLPDAAAAGAPSASTSASTSALTPTADNLSDPYPVKYSSDCRREKVILVPNVSEAFAKIMSAAIRKQGFRAEALPLGGQKAIRLGKRYVHNDICFPAQVTIGEALAALESGRYDECEVAIGTGKLIGDCRLTHYAALLRKALDDAGYPQVPIITNDGKDHKRLHPGFKMSALTQARVALTLPMLDALEKLLRKMRPYETVAGETERAFGQAIDLLAVGIERGGIRRSVAAFREAIGIMCNVGYDRSKPKPRVLLIGEYLLNFHPGSNNNVERYLEENGMEVVLPNMADVYQKFYFCQKSQILEYRIKRSPDEALWVFAADGIFRMGHTLTERIAAAHPLYERAPSLRELTGPSDGIIHHTFDSGEGFLIAAEMLYNAREKVRAFVILQPFGCLPNHICGRGISKRLKELFPDIQILPLDFDPDTSFANIENRLQMLIMNNKPLGSTD